MLPIWVPVAPILPLGADGVQIGAQGRLFGCQWHPLLALGAKGVQIGAPRAATLAGGLQGSRCRACVGSSGAA